MVNPLSPAEQAQHEFLAALAQLPEVIAIDRPPSARESRSANRKIG
jgi:hypothetical protein